jgi:hypothetical protein
MKVKHKGKIGNQSVIRFVAPATVDPEKTKQKIAPMITPGMSEQDMKNLYMKNLVYAEVGPEAELVEDGPADQIQEKLKARGENRQLLENGEYIADYRGIEYWISKKGMWKKEKIEELGAALPTSAILPDALTKEQQEEIAAQQEIERIAALPKEKKVGEMERNLRALVQQADQEAAYAELMERPFDKKEWFKQKRAEIEKKYV